MPVAIYYWWSNKEVNSYNDLRNPVIPAIATLRGVGWDYEIKVIDVSKKSVNWGHFPKKLDFEVRRASPYYQSYRMLSKIKHCFDLTQELNQNTLILDCDVFWKKIPKLFFEKPVACHPSNTGVVYFNVNTCKIFVDKWLSIIDKGIEDQELKKLVLSYYLGHGLFQDEAVFCYLKQTLPDFYKYVQPLTSQENNFGIHYDKHVNNHHCVRFNFMILRGLFPLVYQIFYHNMSCVLNENDLRMIYGPYYSWAGRALAKHGQRLDINGIML